MTVDLHSALKGLSAEREYGYLRNGSKTFIVVLILSERGSTLDVRI